MVLITSSISVTVLYSITIHISPCFCFFTGLHFFCLCVNYIDKCQKIFSLKWFSPPSQNRCASYLHMNTQNMQHMQRKDSFLSAKQLPPVAHPVIPCSRNKINNWETNNNKLEKKRKDNDNDQTAVICLLTSYKLLPRLFTTEWNAFTSHHIKQNQKRCRKSTACFFPFVAWISGPVQHLQDWHSNSRPDIKTWGKWTHTMVKRGNKTTCHSASSLRVLQSNTDAFGHTYSNGTNGHASETW